MLCIILDSGEHIFLQNTHYDIAKHDPLVFEAMLPFVATVDFLLQATRPAHDTQGPVDEANAAFECAMLSHCISQCVQVHPGDHDPRDSKLVSVAEELQGGVEYSTRHGFASANVDRCIRKTVWVAAI